MCDQHVFHFDVDRAFLHQLLETLDGSPVHPLEAPQAPRALGVYLLYLDGGQLPTYVGVSTSKDGIRSRLQEHRRKIAGRRNIQISDIVCRYLVLVSKWEAVHAEAVLLEYFSPEWNRLRGFAGHIPGGGRPGIEGRVNQWDQLYPRL